MNPTPEEIKHARLAAGLTQTEAGRLVHAALRSWQHWEYGEAQMNLATWELFNIKVKLKAIKKPDPRRQP